MCFAKHILNKHNFGPAGPKAQTRPTLFFFFFSLDLAMRERFTRACNNNQLIILAIRKETYLDMRLLEVKSRETGQKKKQLRGAAASIGFAAPFFFLCFTLLGFLIMASSGVSSPVFFHTLRSVFIVSESFRV